MCVLGPRDGHTKWRSGRRQILYDIAYVWHLKNVTDELIYRTETDSQIQKTNLWLAKGKGGSG